MFLFCSREFADSFAWSALLVGRPPLLQPWPTQTSRAGYGSRALQTKKNHTNKADPSETILNRVIYLSDFLRLV